MNQLFNLFLLQILFCMISCNSANTDESKIAQSDSNRVKVVEENYAVNLDDILKNSMSWWTYTSHNIHFSENFIGLDSDSKLVEDKSSFLNEIIEGNVIPIKVKKIGDKSVLKLYKIPNLNDEIQLIMQQQAKTALEHFKKEGTEIPEFDLTDIKGKRYTRANTKGKTLLFKCWFIRCVACVKEFPDLNKLVDEYKDKKDILFVSLAIDEKQDLATFLNKKEFNYAVVPNQRNFMENDLEVKAYPTHILVDKTGKIVKVTNTIDEMLPFFKNETVQILE